MGEILPRQCPRMLARAPNYHLYSLRFLYQLEIQSKWNKNIVTGTDFSRSKLSFVFVWFDALCLSQQIRHVGPVSPPNHTFFLGKLDKVVNQYFVHILSLVKCLLLVSMSQLLQGVV